MDLGKWSIPEIEPINIDGLNRDIAEPTKLELYILELPLELSLEVPTKLVTLTSPKIKISKGFLQFNKYYDSLLNGPDGELLRRRRALLTHLALEESGFNSYVRNHSGAPAYGYFLFMLGPYKGKNYNNIGLFAGVDLETFRNNPALLILAANKLANYFMSSFSKLELDLMHSKGWTNNAIIAGAWLGGPGGVRAYVFRNQDRGDGGTTVGKRMKAFNY